MIHTLINENNLLLVCSYLFLERMSKSIIKDCHALSLFRASRADGHSARQTVSTSRASRHTAISSCSG